VIGLTVVVATRGSPVLPAVVDSLEDQTCPRDDYEVLVVDDGSVGDTERWCGAWQDGKLRRYVRQDRCGLPPARNLGLFMSGSPLVLFLDEDEIADPELIEEHRRAHRSFPDPVAAVVGRSTWDVDSSPPPLMQYLSRADPLPLAYPYEPPELKPSVVHFRSRQLSVKRSFLAQRGAFAPTFGPLADVELGCRLLRHGLVVRFWSHARSRRTTTVTFGDWCEELHDEGRYVGFLASEHDHPAIRSHCRVEVEIDRWRREEPHFERLVADTQALERDVGPVVSGEGTELLRLWRLYWRCFAASRARGVAETAGRRAP
jgi:glycosyltransferase involved in cell wall biosynthesis